MRTVSLLGVLCIFTGFVGHTGMNKIDLLTGIGVICMLTGYFLLNFGLLLFL